ncbi:hypothetical protein KDK82_1589 [Delftia sp. K82]|nr:hypothetical protein KDK82_1589 [Delftia sp. K82]
MWAAANQGLPGWRRGWSLHRTEAKVLDPSGQSLGKLTDSCPAYVVSFGKICSAIRNGHAIVPRHARGAGADLVRSRAPPLDRLSSRRLPPLRAMDCTGDFSPRRTARPRHAADTMDRDMTRAVTREPDHLIAAAAAAAGLDRGARHAADLRGIAPRAGGSHAPRWKPPRACAPCAEAPNPRTTTPETPHAPDAQAL